MIITNKVGHIHMPKTGGGFLDRLFYQETKKIRRNYYVSFIGNDDSRFINDERSTQGEEGNQCRIELIFNRDNIVELIKNSPHFKESYLFSGHFTSAIDELFTEYSIKYFTIVREPIIRTLSNIMQFTNYNSEMCWFAGESAKVQLCSSEYWDWIHETIKNKYPFKALSIPENLFMSDAQTRILQGSKYTSMSEKPSIKLALDCIQRKKIKISFFENFNQGLQKSLDYYNIPINLQKSNSVGDKVPTPQKMKLERFGDYYGATKKMLSLVKEMNVNDIILYEKLKQKI